jgi:zinc protease
MIWNRRWRFICLWFVLLLPALAWSANDDSARKLFPVSEFTLANGLRVFLLEDHNCPIVSVQVWYHVGSANEPAGKQGFAHLFEHMMFRGTDRLGPTDHADLIKSVGGNCNAFTDFDETCYHETLPSRQLELALWLESERMAFLTVDTTGFTTERKVVEEERRLGLNQPYGDLADIALPIVFGQHPYGHPPIGTIRDLRKATPADVHDWWVQWYVPNNATLVLVGDVNGDQAKELVGGYFGWIPSVPLPARDVARLGSFTAAQPITLKLENAPASAIGLVWRTVPEGDPEFLNLELLATIIGGGESSRIYRKLVAEDHAAVMAVAIQQGLSKAGGFGMGAVVSPFGGDLSRALSTIRTELDRVLKDGMTEQELNKARNQMVNQLVSSTDTVEGKAQLIGRAVVVGSGIDELNSRLERLRHVTRDDLQRTAQKYLQPEHALTVTIPGAGLIGNVSRLLFGGRNAEEALPTAPAADIVLRGRPGVTRPGTLVIKAPVADGNPPIPNPKVEEHRLANGLRTLIVPNETCPELRLQLVLPHGSWAEAKPGAASMTLKMLSKGTQLHDDKALAEELERHAIDFAVSPETDDGSLIMSCLIDQAEHAFSLLGEIVSSPTFPQDPFKTTVAQTLTELTMADSDPGSVAEREFARQLFPKHPYGRRVSGEPADVSALKREDLADFWKLAADPRGATLIITGGLPPQRSLELAEKFFARWQSDAAASTADAIKEPATPTPGKDTSTRILLVDWPQAGQSEIRVGSLGLLYRDPEKPIANLVGSYFGGSFGSRLMKAIRVEKGATYGAGAGFRSRRFGGSFEVTTFTKTASTADTLKLVLGEIRNLREKPPTAEELALHRRYFLGSAAEHFETPGEIASHLARVVANGMPLDHVQRNFERIGQTDAGQCAALVRRIVDPERLLIIVVGDAARVANDLRTIAPVTILDRSGNPRMKIESPKAGNGV